MPLFKLSRVFGAICSVCVLYAAVGPAFSQSGALQQVAEVSVRFAARTTDRAYNSNHSKASALYLTPDIYLVDRWISPGFEAKFTARDAAQRAYATSKFDTNLLLGTVEIGPRFGGTSVLAVWEPTYSYQPRTHREYIFFNEGGVKFKRAMRFGILGGRMVPASLKLAYVWAHPDGFNKARLVADAEVTNQISPRLRIIWIPEIGFARYENFFGKQRFDAVASLRMTPRYDFGGGISAALSLFVSAAASTHSQKSGVDFEIRPELKWRM